MIISYGEAGILKRVKMKKQEIIKTNLAISVLAENNQKLVVKDVAIIIIDDVSYILLPVKPDKCEIKKLIEENKLRTDSLFTAESEPTRLFVIENDCIFLKTTEVTLQIPFSQILYCTSDKAYTKINIIGIKPILISRNIGELEKALKPSDMFYRIHDRTLIGCLHIKPCLEIKSKTIIMIDDREFDIARRRKKEFWESEEVKKRPLIK